MGHTFYPLFGQIGNTHFDCRPIIYNMKITHLFQKPWFPRFLHQIMIWLHNWTPGQICPSRYDIKLYVSSRTSRKCSYKLDKYMDRWRALRANVRGFCEAYTSTFPKTKHIVEYHIYLDKFVPGFNYVIQSWFVEDISNILKFRESYRFVFP